MLSHNRSGAAEPDTALHLDSVAAIICHGDRFLLQHCEDEPHVSYPGWWSLFGGAREPGETAEAAIQRELREELALQGVEYRLLTSCRYDLVFEQRLTRKAFFAVELDEGAVESLVLGEGQAMAWLDFNAILAIGRSVVPYDLSILALYAGSRR